MRSLLLSLACAASLQAVARAQLVVANDQPGAATIWLIDVSTGAATPIYSSSTTEAKAWGMAYDAGTQTLYWNNSGALFSSPMGASLTPVSLGSLTFNGGPVDFVGLSYANGRLYGTRNVPTEAVYEIDPLTLVATQVYVYPSSFDFGGLEHDAVTGILYGLTDSPSSGRGLYSIDLVGQSTTFHAPYPAGETDIDALAVHDGRAYYVTDGPNTVQASFYVFDIASGALIGTLPSPFTGGGSFSAATWVGGASSGPTAYCTAGTSSNGCVPAISASGTQSVAASSGFSLAIANVEGQKQGLIFYGVSGRAALPWGVGGSSFLCVKSPTQRLPAQSSGGTSGVCNGAISNDWLAYLAANPGSLGAPFSPGVVVNAQGWYRDPPAVKTTNLSDALEFTTLP